MVRLRGWLSKLRPDEFKGAPTPVSYWAPRTCPECGAWRHGDVRVRFSRPRRELVHHCECRMCGTRFRAVRVDFARDVEDCSPGEHKQEDETAGDA